MFDGTTTRTFRFAYEVADLFCAIRCWRSVEGGSFSRVGLQQLFPPRLLHECLERSCRFSPRPRKVARTHLKATDAQEASAQHLGLLDQCLQVFGTDPTIADFQTKHARRADQFHHSPRERLSKFFGLREQFGPLVGIMRRCLKKLFL